MCSIHSGPFRTASDHLNMYRLLMIWLVLFAAPACAGDNPDWRAPLAPFQIADNLYYVGSRDLAAYLVTTPKGNILINANLATSPSLGFGITMFEGLRSRWMTPR